MKSTVENPEPTKAVITVEAEYDELKPQMDRAYKDIASQVSIPGFRKGHVPPQIIDKRFGRAAVIEQAVNEVLPGMYSQAIADNELRPLGQPEVEVTEIPNTEGEQGGKLSFTATVDVVPAFELPKLDEEVAIEVDPSEVTDADVDAELDELRGRFASLKPITRKAKTGDYATISLKATVDGETVDEVSDVSYEIGSGDMLDGQDTALRGTKAGEDVTFTSKLKGGEHEGEEAEVSIHVESVKERELPEADDDFAQMVSEFDTIDELKDDLRMQAATRKRSDQAVQAREKLLDYLMSHTDIQLPEAAIEHELEHRVDEDADDAAKKEAREEVETGLKRELLLENLARTSDTQVSQQELLEFLFQTAQAYGADVNQLAQDPDAIQSMVGQLARTKALVNALGEVTVKDTDGEEVDLSEFIKPAEEPAAEDGDVVVAEEDELVEAVEEAGEDTDADADAEDDK